MPRSLFDFGAPPATARFARWLMGASWFLVGWCLLPSLTSTCRADEAADREFFELRIRPVLVRHCYECHSALAAEPKGGLRLDTREALRAGGDSGPAIVPGNPAESLLLEALRHESLAMPPDEKLPEAVVADFVRWVEMGAPDPRDEAPDGQTAVEEAWEAQYQQRLNWWSLHAVIEPPVPPVGDAAWSSHPVDRFILARLEQQGLAPAPPSEPTTLARRLSFALTGLPPDPADVRRFVENPSPGAWEELVDRLIASPHFGERWARHWMDVVRYTDTYGYEWDMPAKGAWRYRDYLVRAFNADVPFDQMVREQIAGDLLEPPRIDPVNQINESLIGVMFYQMGEKRHGDSAEFNGVHQEMLDNKIDAFTKAFQAATLSCARCHDHKLDPIAQREYYALGGVFMSSRWVTNTLDLPERNQSLIRELEAIKLALRPALAAQWLDDAAMLADDLLAASQRPAPGDAPPAEAPAASAEQPVGEQTAVSEPPGGPDRILIWQKLLAESVAKEPPLEDPLRPWFELSRAASEANGPALVERWQALAQQYADERRARSDANARDYLVLADFRQGPPPGWSVDGAGLQSSVACGDLTLALDGSAAVGRLLPGGLFTHAVSPCLNGAVRTPWLNHFDKEFLSFEYCGGDFSTHRTVIDNAFLTEKQHYLNQPDIGWLTLPTLPSMKDRRIYIELATKTSNPNFPPRVGLGGPCSEEQARDPKSWFGVTRVLLHDAASPPADELARFARLFEGPAPGDLGEVANRYAAWFRAALDRWSRDQAGDDDVRLINWLLDRGLLTNSSGPSAQPVIAEAVARYRQLEQQLAQPQTVNGMADLDPGYDYRLNIRGDYDQLADPVPRGYLRMLGGSESGFAAEGSGRRELAELVASPHNPRTARVFVNRVWHWLFGAGLVATTDDFGHLGERPSHPELLDWLASRFVAEGWSLKRLVRTLVLTQTWRQSGQASAAALAADPDNRLLHHYPLRRLEAESIRDAILRVSSRLDARLFGPPIDPFRQNEDPQKRLFSGPVDGDGRRSIYTKITIMEPPRFLATFNQPEPKIPTGHRDVTTTPAQSLALLNDPFVAGQAEYWAQRLTAADPAATPYATVAGRLDIMFTEALGRPPTAEEIDRWSQAVTDLAALHAVSSHELMQSAAVWKDVAHALFNTKEFIYIR